MKDYIVISKEILINKDLTYLQKFILAKITNLDNDKGCFATNKYFADLLSTSQSCVSKAINNLKNKGLIEVTITNNYERSMTIAKKDRGGVVKGQGGLSKRTGSSVTLNIDTNIDNNKSNKSFNIWWKLYDKKVGKEKALGFWLKKLDHSLVDDILIHTKRYVKSTDKQYRKNPYTYLFNSSWEDEIISEEEDVQNGVEFKLDTTGMCYIGYCSKCGTSNFYNKFNLKDSDSICCKDRILPVRPEHIGGRRDVSNNA